MVALRLHQPCNTIRIIRKYVHFQARADHSGPPPRREDSAALVPARSQSGPLSDVSNSLHRASQRTLSSEIGLVEAPAKGSRLKPGPRVQAATDAQQPKPSPGHLLLDIGEPAVPGLGSEVALGTRAAAVINPMAVVQNTSSSAAAALLSDTGPMQGEPSETVNSPPAQSAPAPAYEDGFEDLDLQENRRARAVSIDDPGGGDGGVDGGGNGNSSSIGGLGRAAPSWEARRVTEAAADATALSEAGSSVSDDLSDDQKGAKGFGAEVESLRCLPPSVGPRIEYVQR